MWKPLGEPNSLYVVRLVLVEQKFKINNILRCRGVESERGTPRASGRGGRTEAGARGRGDKDLGGEFLNEHITDFSDQFLWS